MMNILLSSVGRRNYLVSYFQEALKGKGKVLAIDADPNAAALQAADEAFVAPRFNDPNYLKFVLDICRMREVTLLISDFTKRSRIATPGSGEGVTPGAWCYRGGVRTRFCRFVP